MASKSVAREVALAVVEETEAYKWAVEKGVQEVVLVLASFSTEVEL